MTKRARTFGRRTWLGVFGGALATGALGCEQATQRSDVTVTAAGATFPYPLYERWRIEYARETGVVLAYSPSGSSDGILAITTDRTDFAGTDLPLTDDQVEQAGDVLHIPLTLGAVAIAYNVPEVPNELRLDGETLARIFLGEIKTWNDPQIQGLNPDEKLPSRPIVVVTRADGSGTTKILTEYLSTVSPTWKERVGSAGAVTWPTGFAVQRNDGVADTIMKKRGTIGYVNTAFAASRRLNVAAIKNRAGEFQMPSPKAATRAAEESAARLPDDLRMFIVNAEGKGSYPISAYSYALIRKEAPDPQRTAEAVKFLWWGLHEGQRFAPALTYAELPATIVKKAEQVLRQVEHRGKPVVPGL